MRVIAYIDGMNFYEVSKDKKWYPAGWCNWTESIAEYCPGAQVAVRYFTTLYTGRSKVRTLRQKLHILAMTEVARAEIVYGSCRERMLTCPECKSALTCRCGCKTRTVEKMTDVNIAVRLFEDAVDRVFDRAYIVSGDVDLMPGICAALRRNAQCQVVVLLPPETIVAEEFTKLETDYPRRAVARFLDLKKLSRFPDDLPRRWGMTLPPHWRQAAGRRPVAPDAQPVAVTAARRRVEWYDESVGYGSRAGQ
jgi:uncharacterized LabA/DUF88 family protein